MNTSANINVRKTPLTSPNPPRSTVSFRTPSPFKVNQRVENKTVLSATTSSISTTRPPSVKLQAVGVQKSISSNSTVTRTDRPVVLSSATSRANTSSPELVTHQRRTSVTLHPPKPIVTGVSRTAPSSPLVPAVNPRVQSSPTLSSLRDLQPSPTPSIRITSKVTKLSVNAKASATSEPATPNSVTGLGHRTFASRSRVSSVSNLRNMENSSTSPPSRSPVSSISENTKLAITERPRVPSISQDGLHFIPPSTSATPTPTSTSSSPPLRSASPLLRHRRVPSVAKSDIIYNFSSLQINGNEDVTVQAPRPIRPNVGLPSANFSPKYSPFSSGNTRPNLHLKVNSSPGTSSTNKFPVIAKIDPLSIPLPLNSPPTSTLSYSSRSTVSSSSAISMSPQHSALSGIGPTLNSHDGTGLGMGMTHRRRVSGVGVNGNLNRHPPNVDNQTNGVNAARVKRGDPEQILVQGGIQFLQRATEEDLGDSDAGSSLLDDLDLHEEDQGNSDRRMRAEAKSIRKIEDLEITNRSLMVINASLEAAKHRQAKEIRDLRRKLRESRLILPPKAYRLVTFGQTGNTSLDTDPDGDDDGDDEDDDTDEIGILDVEKINDEGFKRCWNLLESLLENGRQALAAKPEDFEVAPSSATKVLHAEELRSEADPDERDRHDGDADTSIISVDPDSEDEVEGMVSIRITTPMPPSP
ncbi:hypothetical protein BDM02DRAFT_3185488 [Thelephora ganbajun]|uniref:Uncharacterized protein n=1 Tax=Thelephora ganbajun TaxID=370292 RepID=A0ACB6ZKC7_THEGA|nr:hypothetical protein BDM02DRAFT_3185488 [Thelephora ganbajun]